MNTHKTVQIAEDIYWVGSSRQIGGLHCNSYLIIDGNEGILIDPGSAIDFKSVYENVCSLLPLKKIKYVILHHQDPDLASSVPFFEKKGGKFKIVTNWRTGALAKYYGLKSQFYIVDKNEFKLVLKSGRVIGFVQTPHLDYLGAICTYDYKSKILFTGDLFGAFSYKWSLYAEEDYIENMKTFCEHYMISNKIIRSVMGIFLEMDISMIAPQHGSIIKDDVKKYIIALRGLEGGPFGNSINKDILKSNGYIEICNLVLKRYASIFNEKEVLEVLGDMDIRLNENIKIVDHNYTEDILWNIIFEKILEKKGILWIKVIEPFVQNLSIKYNIDIPKVFITNIKKADLEVKNINEENKQTIEINERLERSIEESENNLIRCKVTGLYNYDMLKNFLSEDIEGIITDNSYQNPGLLIISLDHIGKITDKYGDSIIDEILIKTVHILDSLREDNEVFFRLEGILLACYVPNTTKDKLLNFAERIRISIDRTEIFIEKLTASIGVACLDEVRNDSFHINNADETLYNLAVLRVKIAKRMGKNIVCNSSNVINYRGEIGNILLVDTDVTNMDVLKSFLENLNFKIFTASDGEEALKIVEQNPIDLIVSEIILPKIDGFIVREKLLKQRHNRNIPFIIVSIQKDDDSVNRATQLGIEHYFQKPFMLSEFLGVVKIKMKGESYI